MEFLRNYKIFKGANKTKYMVYAALILLMAGILTWSRVIKLGLESAGLLSQNENALDKALTLQSPASHSDSFFSSKTRHYDEVKAGENLYATLRRLSFPAEDADRLIKAIGAKIDLRSIKTGSVLMVEFYSDNIQLNNLTILKQGEGYLRPSAVELFTKDSSGITFSVHASLSELDKNVQVQVNKAQLYKERGMIDGVVSNSVYSAILAKGGDAQLVNSFADIFMWQFDFFRDTREGDAYKMIFEKNVVDGRLANYGRILAAEYANGPKKLRGFYFKSGDNSIEGYFDEKGMSLRNAFLKAPLKLAFITSPFNRRRFHPVQKIIRPHNGIDYGANVNTPFMAVAGGHVINAGYSPFNGNWVRLKHINGYETEYLHANRLAKGIRVGTRVKQGQVIGYVGKTGLATGYHLHFGMKKSGSYVDPSKQKFAREIGVPTKYIKEFNRSIEAMGIALNQSSNAKTDVLALK